MRCKLCILVLIAGAIVVAVGCVSDASHDNPYDPLSASYRGTGTIRGTVTLYNKSSKYLSGIVVTVMPNNIATTTDSSGSFVLKNVPSGAKMLYFTATGYAADSLQVAVPVGGTQTVTMAMNAAPVVLSTNITMRTFADSTNDIAIITTSIWDPNGTSSEIDSVTFMVEDNEYMFTMSWEGKENDTVVNYTRSITWDEIPTSLLNRMDWFVGKKLYVVVTDQHGATTQSSAFAVTRLFYDRAKPISPIGASLNQSADSVLFSWSPASVSFDYTYTLYVWQSPTQLNTVVGISSTATSYTLSQKSGDHSWAVVLVDRKGNQSCSKIVSFSVP